MKRYRSFICAGIILSVAVVLAACSGTPESGAGTSAEGTSVEESGSAVASTEESVEDSTEDSVEASGTEGTPSAKITVYDASEDKGNEGTFVTPGVKLGDIEITEVNDEISRFVDKIKEDSEWFAGTEYSYYDGGEFVSLLVRGISTIDCDSYKAFNISAATGKLMSDEELLAAAGQDSSAFAGLVKKTVEDAMADDKEGTLFTVVEDMDYKAENLKDSNLAQAAPFVSERGNLCFIYDLQMCVGAEEYTVCLDTVTHEHMLNDFGNWTLYPDWG